MRSKGAGMNKEIDIRQTLEQIARLANALVTLHENLGAFDSNVFMAMSEGPLDHIQDLIRELQPQIILGRENCKKEKATVGK